MFFNFKKRIFSERGVIIIMASITLTLLLLLSFYFLNFTVSELKISESQSKATQVYYLAEAGINEAIWKLKYDPTWKSNFEIEGVCENWSADFSRVDVLFPNSSYEVHIQNSDCARGEIISTAQLSLADGRVVQRELKVKIFKAFGSLTEDSAIFSGGTSENVSIQFSNINIYDGNFFSNKNLNIKYFSTVNVEDNPETEEKEGKVLAGGNISEVASTINSIAICSKNICYESYEDACFEEGCPPESAAMPGVNFNLEDTDSYYSRAQTLQNNLECSVLCDGALCATDCIYTEDDFEDLLWQVGKGKTLILNNKITYVTGGIDLKGERRIVVNGILIADGTVNIGERYCWTKQGQKDCGFNQITINDPGPEEPSGLLTQKKMNFGPYSSFEDINIVGLLYAYDELKIVSMPKSFNITGGILARKISFTSAWLPVNIYLDNIIISEAIWGGPVPPIEEDLPYPYSPVVTIEHWEETY